MMIAYELHKPEGEAKLQDSKHEVTLKAEDEGDILRLMALISLHQHGQLTAAIDHAITVVLQGQQPT